jgi:mono/diheme cytochrome c family protein
MQTKIIIGTIAFMLTMIILGFIALNEPARLQAFSAAYEGRSIENGAEVFVNNCATCHGIDGTATQCFDAAGAEIGCVGRPLNTAELLCGNRPARLEAMGWTGAKFDFIEGTIAAGRPWAGMPTWGQQFGGPLQNNEVRDVALFVQNWESEALCGGEQVEGPVWPSRVSELPAGDPENGAAIYQLPFACNACHGALEDESTANGPGPWLGSLSAEAGDRKEGYTAADYLYESILLPNAHIAPECLLGGEPADCTEPSQMRGDYGQAMTQQDMADIISYVLGTAEFESNVDVQYPEGSVPPPADE